MSSRILDAAALLFIALYVKQVRLNVLLVTRICCLINNGKVFYNTLALKEGILSDSKSVKMF